jgi:crotonobetainyl-CoA:carnitine CoA-transferase CaiB-like acyl-CoA transferase
VSGICDGLNVVEMGAGSAAASITGMVLADAGARVVKVEPPEGDRLRSQVPSAWLVWNRGKESLVADLRTADGQRDLRALAAGADVVIEGFSPGTTDGWGIGADSLCGLNPRLVHCAITAFGPTGPYLRVKGYDTLVSAKVGLFARGGYAHRDGPIVYPRPWGSHGAAMQSVAAILGALLVRDTTGRGQQLHSTLVAGMDPVDYFLTAVVQLMAKRGEAPALDARSATEASRYGVLVATRDGRFIQTSTMLPHQGRALCEVAGIGHIVEDARFARLPMFATAEDAQEWENLLWQAFRTQDLDHWLPRLMASPDVAFEVAVTCEEGLDHPQIVHNGDVMAIDDPVVGPVRQVGPIGRFSSTPCRSSRSAPALGAYGGPFSPAPSGASPSRASGASAAGASASGAAASPSGAAPSGAAPLHPLSGVTIVEFGYFYAMPYGVTMAAALGARVIKLEDANGDPHRRSFGEEVASAKTTAGKESVSLDLSTPEGRAIAQRIVAKADVFVTGFRTGVAEKLGLGYADLRAINPRLLYVHAAGYGSDGPYAGRALYAQPAQTVAGSFGRQVGYWADPARNIDLSVLEVQVVVQPRLNQVVDGDSNAALGLLAALVLGIYHQRRTGEGQLLQTSMIGGNAWAYSDDFNRYAGKPPVPVCDSEYYGTSALERVYPAADGWVCLVVRTEREWRALASTIDVRDARFASPAGRAEHDEALVEVLSARFAERPAAEWEAVLTDVDVGCVAVSMNGQPAFTSFDPVMRETGLSVVIEHPRFGPMVVAAPSVRLSETPGRVGLPCMRGQHNRSVLAELGYSEDEIDKFEANGIVFPP